MVNSGLLFHFFASRVQTFSPAAAAEPTHSNCQERKKKTPQTISSYTKHQHIHTHMGLLDNFICTRYTLHSFIRWPSITATHSPLPPSRRWLVRSLPESRVPKSYLDSCNSDNCIPDWSQSTAPKNQLQQHWVQIPPSRYKSKLI